MVPNKFGVTIPQQIEMQVGLIFHVSHVMFFCLPTICISSHSSLITEQVSQTESSDSIHDLQCLQCNKQNSRELKNLPPRSDAHEVHPAGHHFGGGGCWFFSHSELHAQVVCRQD